MGHSDGTRETEKDVEVVVHHFYFLQPLILSTSSSRVDVVVGLRIEQYQDVLGMNTTSTKEKLNKDMCLAMMSEQREGHRRLDKELKGPI